MPLMNGWVHSFENCMPRPPGLNALYARPRSLTWNDAARDRKSTRLNSSHGYISYAVFWFEKKFFILCRGLLIFLLPVIARTFTPVLICKTIAICSAFCFTLRETATGRFILSSIAKGTPLH